MKNIIKKLIKIPYEKITTSISNHYLKKHFYRIESGSKIKVGFIVQMPEIWNKIKKVYDIMSKDSHFETTMIIVPQYNFKNLKINNFYEGEDEYFISECKGKYITILKDGEFINKIKSKFDYVFYQRPYDNYLPKFLRSFFINKNSRVCFIPYGMTGTNFYNSSVINKKFIRNASVIFFDVVETQKAAINIQAKNCKKNFQKFIYLGYPSLDLEKINLENNYRNIMWMPRWGDGSHFDEYNDIFLEFINKNVENQFIFRPHPLLRDFLERNNNSNVSFDNYIEKLNKKNVIIDNNKLIETTLEFTDIIVTDYTSLFPLFFMLGKAVIYCPSKKVIFNDTFNKLLPGLYIANNEEELKEKLTNLILKKDPLCEVRKKIAYDFFYEHHDSSRRILAFLIENIIKK